MFTYKPVTLTRGSFRFCRYSVAVAMWVGVLMRLEWLIVFCACVMALSAIFTVGRAPLITFYRLTVDRLWPSAPEVVDESGLRFAHVVATVFMSVPLLLIHAGHVDLGWQLLGFVAVFKTAGALGFCAVSRLYTCMISQGMCCTFLNRSSHE